MSNSCGWKIEIKQNRIVYKCPAGQHDDLAFHAPCWCGPHNIRICQDGAGLWSNRESPASQATFDQFCGMDVNVIWA